MSSYDNNQITRYLTGELSPEELQQFEAALQQDQELAREVEKCRAALDTLQERLPIDEKLEALRIDLKQLNREHFTPKAKVISFRKYMIAAVAAAVIVFTIILWPTEHFLNEWGNMNMISSTERGKGANQLIQTAAVHFNRREYKLALPLLNKAVAADSSNQMVLFYRGVAEFHVGEKEAARADLEKVFSGNSIFKYEAAFFLAVGYAADKEKEKSIEWLDKIPEESHVSSKAAKLRAEL